MHNQHDFLQSISPHHGQVLQNVLSKETQAASARKLGAMPNGQTWYADIYDKAIYGPMVFREQELGVIETIAELLPGSGQLSIVMEEGAVRLSLIREANQLHSLVRVVDPSVPEHLPFQITQQEYDYLERTKVTPALDAGDALLFCNAFFHKSENVDQGTRSAYILRLVRKDAKFSKTRLLALRKLGAKPGRR